MQYVLGNMLNGAGGLNADGLSLDLQFAADKTMTARKGPNPVFTRGSTGTFVGSNGLIQTAAVNSPRFDHTSAGVCRGLLIEESRTNQITFSENFTDTSWSSFATASAANITSTNPSGGTTTSRLTANSGTSTGRSRVKLFNIPSASYAATVSCFVKAGNSDFGLVSMAFNKSGVGGVRTCNANIVFSTGVITKSGTSNADFTVTSTAFPDGWYRITISATSNASITVEDQVVLSVGLAFNGTGGSGTFAGTETVLAWGAQLEAGSFATSYIPTVASTVVRSADVCSITGANFTSFYNPVEGSLATSAIFNAPVANATSQAIVDINDTTTANRLRLFRTNSNGFGNLANTSNSTQNVTIASTVSSQPFITQKYASGFKLDDYAFYINNSQIGTDNLGAMPISVTTFTIGDASSGFTPRLYLNGTLAAIRYYRKRLPNAKLAQLTV